MPRDKFTNCIRVHPPPRLDNDSLLNILLLSLSSICMQVVMDEHWWYRDSTNSRKLIILGSASILPRFRVFPHLYMWYAHCGHAGTLTPFPLVIVINYVEKISRHHRKPSFSSSVIAQLASLSLVCQELNSNGLMSSEILSGSCKGSLQGFQLQLQEVYNCQCHFPHFYHETPSFRQYDEKVAHLTVTASFTQDVI
jgi:hypothetical protein